MILETDKKEEQIDVLKFYRGIFCNRVLTESTLIDMQDSFQKFVRANEETFNGRTWLNILEISRYAELPDDFVEEYLAKKLDVVYQLENLGLKTIEPIVHNLSFNQMEMMNLADKEQSGRSRKNMYKRMQTTSIKEKLDANRKL